MREIGKLDLVMRSPNMQRVAILEYIDEVRFGPPYYALWLKCDPSEVKFVRCAHEDCAAIYGKVCSFSPDSRFFVAPRWQSIVKMRTFVQVVDCVDHVQSDVLDIGASFVRDIDFAMDVDVWSGDVDVGFDAYEREVWSSRRLRMNVGNIVWSGGVLARDSSVWKIR